MRPGVTLSELFHQGLTVQVSGESPQTVLWPAGWNAPLRMFLRWLFLHWSCGQERPCAFLKRDNESVPNHGASSRDEGVREQGPEVVSVESVHTVVGDSIISFSSVLSPEHHP